MLLASTVLTSEGDKYEEKDASFIAGYVIASRCEFRSSQGSGPHATTASTSSS
jgi:hypothetical protein